jgi:hypothetical protein
LPSWSPPTQEPKFEYTPQGEVPLGELAGELVFEVPVDVEVDEIRGFSKKSKRSPDLVLDLGSLDAQLVRLPQNGYLLGQTFLRPCCAPEG